MGDVLFGEGIEIDHYLSGSITRNGERMVVRGQDLPVLDIVGGHVKVTTNQEENSGIFMVLSITPERWVFHNPKAVTSLASKVHVGGHIWKA